MKLKYKNIPIEVVYSNFLFTIPSRVAFDFQSHTFHYGIGSVGIVTMHEQLVKFWHEEKAEWAGRRDENRQRYAKEGERHSFGHEIRQNDD